MFLKILGQIHSQSAVTWENGERKHHLFQIILAHETIALWL